jgi:TM2 domain-containing membrane protein YozV
MICSICGNTVADGIKFCTNCGTRLVKAIPDTGATSATSHAEEPRPAGVIANKSRVTAGVLGLLLGFLGIHKFYLGYNKPGLIMLAVCLLGAFILVGPVAVSIIGFVEGILYLAKSDDDFKRIYVDGRKEWF